MTTLMEFLRARLDEDEVAARRVPESEYGWHLIDPARVLREVEAKRRIVAEHEPLEEYAPPITFCGACGGNPTRVGSYPCYTMRLLALPYSDHPDYDQKWAP